jgi:hypothetical protein
MATGKFTINADVQEVELNENEIMASSDSLNSYLEMPAKISIHFKEENIEIDFLSFESNLFFGDMQMVCSDIHSIKGGTYFNNNKIDLNLKFKITKDVISQIEKFRQSDVKFYIKLKFLFIIKNRIKLESNQNLYSEMKETSISFEIPQSKWVNSIMPKLGYNNIRLIEIPKAHNQLSDDYIDIKKEFDKAESYFNNKDYHKCVAHCRNAIDSFNRNLKKIRKDEQSESAYKWLNKITESSLTWITEVCSSTFELTSKTHHVSNSREFTRQEAESIFLVVLGLINFIAHEKNGTLER